MKVWKASKPRISQKIALNSPPPSAPCRPAGNRPPPPGRDVEGLGDEAVESEHAQDQPEDRLELAPPVGSLRSGGARSHGKPAREVRDGGGRLAPRRARPGG